MNDCSNAEICDQLPDLLHERLDVSAREVVVAHVATCIDCRDELQLLRDVRGMMAMQTPTIDVGRILSALPKPPVAHQTLDRAPAEATITPISARRRVWADWRVAAAVTLLIAGGSSAVLLNRAPSDVSRPSRSAAVVAVSPGIPANAPTAGNSAPTSGADSDGTGQPTLATSDDHANADLGNGSRLGDLTESQLQQLLTEIDKLPAVPVVEPEPVSLNVSSQVSSSGGV